MLCKSDKPSIIIYYYTDIPYRYRIVMIYRTQLQTNMSYGIIYYIKVLTSFDGWGISIKSYIIYNS